MWVKELSQDFSNKAFKKTAEKYDSDSKDYYMISQTQEVNKSQLVLVHHLRFYGMKRSLWHQDGAKDEGMTQFHLLYPRKSKCFHKHAPNIKF